MSPPAVLGAEVGRVVAEHDAAAGELALEILTHLRLTQRLRAIRTVAPALAVDEETSGG